MPSFELLTPAGEVMAMRDLIEEHLVSPRSSAMLFRQITEIREGLPIAQAERAYERLGFTLEEAATSLGFSPRTLDRHKNERQRLGPVESEKMLRLARVGAAAIQAFGQEELARRWLRTPLRALEGAARASLLDTDIGAEAVLDVLTRIEHGVIG